MDQASCLNVASPRLFLWQFKQSEHHSHPEHQFPSVSGIWQAISIVSKWKIRAKFMQSVGGIMNLFGFSKSQVYVNQSEQFLN